MAPDSHRLFFALFPDAETAQAIARVVDGLRAAKTIRGRWTAPERQHVTARFLGDHGHDAPAVIERARAAAALVRCAAFEVAFDRIATFRGRFQCPCVLRCPADAETGVQRLWRGLGDTLAAAGIECRAESNFIPHLTIAYADRMLGDPLPIDPLRWRAHEFALVDSSRSEHRVIERWPLSG